MLDVPRTCGILTEKELDITENYDATALVEKMAKGDLKSVEVVTAFCKRAAVAQQCVSCLTEIMFEEAIARAKECDDALEKEGRVLGPLHGLPISLKVCMYACCNAACSRESVCVIYTFLICKPRQTFRTRCHKRTRQETNIT